jgi:hypothetical protein
VSRWGDAFHTSYRADTWDTCDTRPTPLPSPDVPKGRQVSPSVPCVRPIEDISREAVAPVTDDPSGAGDEPPSPRPGMTPPPIFRADLVEQMAAAMAANPVYRITNRETAMEYFRGVARNQLAAASREQP